MDLNYHENLHINKIKEYIKDNFFKEITLDCLQSIFKINKFTLIRGFKKAYNTTPSAYQLQLKIDYSKQCLHHHHNFAEIALEAGFYDQAHFSKEFKRVYGVTPLDYYKSLNQ
jgi:AraC-like DNA-binding protein